MILLLLDMKDSRVPTRKDCARCSLDQLHWPTADPCFSCGSCFEAHTSRGYVICVYSNPRTSKKSVLLFQSLPISYLTKEVLAIFEQLAEMKALAGGWKSIEGVRAHIDKI